MSSIFEIMKKLTHKLKCKKQLDNKQEEIF